MNFSCSCCWENGKKENWTGRIADIYSYGSHYEISIQSRSSIRILIGQTCSGFFACIPDFQAGCHLGSLEDIFYNQEKLTFAMENVIDAATVASALRYLSDILSF
ncbi:hypothetical protein [Dehalobacterium formicoaceticum]|uniref:Uncharacterized protein n=1 Tax=Dehalobacterium formicoaceticum TaxID=51515 RepID=A0ABT1Y7Y6_9FIRM|nr:hypothetical protein [Dehalobacterium formicoaceticum]MCR6546996.1 hypothetical protein [Dehalobacterium formicoaceticum]